MGGSNHGTPSTIAARRRGVPQRLKAHAHPLDRRQEDHGPEIGSPHTGRCGFAQGVLCELAGDHQARTAVLFNTQGVAKDEAEGDAPLNVIPRNDKAPPKGDGALLF